MKGEIKQENITKAKSREGTITIPTPALIISAPKENDKSGFGGDSQVRMQDFASPMKYCIMVWNQRGSSGFSSAYDEKNTIDF